MIGGERKRWKNTTTKAVIVLVDTRDALNDFQVFKGEPWATVCLDHSWAVRHRTFTLAMAWMAEPWMWCKGCQTISVVSGTTEHRPKGRGEMSEPSRAPSMLDAGLADDHEEGDRCDLGDPHDAAHHFADPRSKAVCLHPDCRADDLNDERKVGV